MKTLIISIRSLILFTLILGGIYPLTVTLISSVLSPIRAGGSLFKTESAVMGSEIIGQKFTKPEYFWSRPSAADYKPLSSGASQRSGTDSQLKKDYLERKLALPGGPDDLLWASASGLDPHISVDSVEFQKERVMKIRGLTEDQMNTYIRKATKDRFLGFMGQPRVNVLELNLLLDKK